MVFDFDIMIGESRVQKFTIVPINLPQESTKGKKKSVALHRQSLVPEARKRREAARADLAAYEAECGSKLAEYRRQYDETRQAWKDQGSNSMHSQTA